MIKMLKTEQRNPKTMHIDEMSPLDMIKVIQEENYNAVKAIDSQVEFIAEAVDKIAERIKLGGRLFYIGCGTSGRLGVLDASECPPTYGVSPDLVVGIIAGGDSALRRASEGTEDSFELGMRDIEAYSINENDSVVGISCAGGAAYVLGAFAAADKVGALKIALTCNKGSKIDTSADIAICTDTGAEVITGSTRMKAGSAHKMVLNMISTAVMVRLGHVCENLMINLRPSNQKLRLRMISIASDLTGRDAESAEKLLEENGFVLKDAIAAARAEDGKEA
jgi:N-acetylmuramic acid 6-phosphate etherase